MQRIGKRRRADAALLFCTLCLGWKKVFACTYANSQGVYIQRGGEFKEGEIVAFNYEDAGPVIRLAQKWAKSEKLDLTLSFYDNGSGYIWQIDVEGKHLHHHDHFDDLAFGITTICSEFAQQEKERTR
jgi:hypothetical protein